MAHGAEGLERAREESRWIGHWTVLTTEFRYFDCNLSSCSRGSRGKHHVVL